MKRHLDILNTELKKISLRDIERVAIKRSLISYMNAHPRKERKVHVSTFGIFAIPSPFMNLMRKTSLVSMLVIVALVLGGGVSFAAENALPGDTLYSFKTNVNEGVQSFFAASSQSQAELQVKFATRRLEEAEQLAVEGRLNNEVKKELGQKISEHTTGFKKQFTQLVKDKNYAKAVTTASEFESTLKAHENVLVAIEGGTGTTTLAAATSTDESSVSTQVRASLSVARDSRVIAENKLNSNSNSDIQFSARIALASSEQAVKSATSYLQEKKSDIDETLYNDLSGKLASSSEKISLGRTKMDADQYGDAFLLFQDGLRGAQEAKVLLETSVKLAIKSDMISPSTEGLACSGDKDCGVGFICRKNILLASTTLSVATSTEETSTSTAITATTTISADDLVPEAFCIPTPEELGVSPASTTTESTASTTDSTDQE